MRACHASSCLKARALSSIHLSFHLSRLISCLASWTRGTRQVGHLQPYAPLARAAEVSSLFLSSVSAVATLAQLLGIDHLLPEPAALFSGRVWAHLHSNTPAGAALVSKVVEQGPLQDLVEAVRAAVLGGVGGAENLFGKLEMEGGFGQRRPQAMDVNFLGLEQVLAPSGATEALPIEEHRATIVDGVRANPVVCIQVRRTGAHSVADVSTSWSVLKAWESENLFSQGETGSGKSSMVPQMLVENARENGQSV